MDWVDIAARYIVPPILGGVAGFFSPWASWEIEKRRQKLARRRELITGWRMHLLPMLGTGQIDWHAVKGNIFASPYYASLRPHISAELLKQLRAERTVYVGGDFPRTSFIEEIGRIEKQWKLV